MFKSIRLYAIATSIAVMAGAGCTNTSPGTSVGYYSASNMGTNTRIRSACDDLPNEFQREYCYRNEFDKDREDLTGVD